MPTGLSRVGCEPIRDIAKRHKGSPDAAPPQVTYREVESVRELANLLGEGVTAIKISAKGERPVKVTPEVAKAVQEIGKALHAEAYREWTTLRGRLDQITTPEEGSIRFRLIDGLTGRRIRCEFDPSLMEQVKNSLQHRVEVSGRAVVDVQGDAQSIDAESIRVLSDDLLPFGDVPAVDVTDGTDTTEYLERLRGGD
jgi:hypothetical protein